MRLIKRYRNRRLYDTSESRTITQFDLARMIREGEEIKVIDSTTERDITLSVLGRVMVSESHSWGDVSETKEVLRHIIYLGGNKSMSILKNTVLASIGVVQVTKAKAEKVIDDLIKKGELDKSKRKAAIMELLEKAEKTSADLREKFVKEAEKAQKGVSKFAKDISWARQQDVQKLESQVEQLNKMIKKLEKKIEEMQSE
ncbi:MAG: polyhydroxyalkanoate synthesis regulator DNA-binding domain-containing protein [Candidatus Zixiibacteriota bacterium]